MAKRRNNSTGKITHSASHKKGQTGGVRKIAERLGVEAATPQLDIVDTPVGKDKKKQQPEQERE